MTGIFLVYAATEALLALIRETLDTLHDSIVLVCAYSNNSSPGFITGGWNYMWFSNAYHTNAFISYKFHWIRLFYAL